MPPAWKVRRGHLVIGSSVCLSVCLSVRNSVPLTNKVQYLKFGWSYSNQTWTVSSSMGSSHFTDITCPWGWGGVKHVGLRAGLSICLYLGPILRPHSQCKIVSFWLPIQTPSFPNLTPWEKKMKKGEKKWQIWVEYVREIECGFPKALYV